MPEELDLEPASPAGRQDEGQEVSIPFEPGELCPIDATDDRVTLEDDEFGTVEEKEACLLELAKAAAKRDLTSGRLEVRDAWKARYFYRGNQELLLGRNGAWIPANQVLIGGQSYDDNNKETNIYLAFADTIVAALTAGLPSVRFEPDDPTDPGDVSAASGADKARRLIERGNDMPVVQQDKARYLFTDGRAAVYTRYVIDGQRFGYQRPGANADLDDELSYLPLEGDRGPDSSPADVELGPGSALPRGQEVVEAFGVLEVKVPIQARTIDDCDYLQLAREFDITRMKTKYPEKADEIQGMQTLAAESEYRRLARTSVMMGMRPSNMTNDAMTYQATEQLTWARPSFFWEEKNKQLREWLWQAFPKGAMVAAVGKTFCEARNEGLNDHWSLIHARPGDGQHRPALGSPLIPLQEKLNDCMDLVHESFMHLIPITWVDSEAIDTAALNEIESKPKQYLKIKRKADKDIAGNFYTEEQIQIAEGLFVYIEKLFGEFAQFLVGAFPALFGGAAKNTDTASGYAMQRDQALGRLGLTWRSIRSSYANEMRQAVQCTAQFRNGKMSGEVPGAGGIKERIAIDPNDLKGNVRCFPDTDENFPESWVAQRAVWNNLMQQAATNPVLARILAVARNMSIAKDKAGLPELVVPGAAAALKQSGETELLLQSDPLPNPAIAQAQEMLAALTATQGTPPEQITQLQQMISNLPPMIPSIPIDEELDDHADEMNEIETFANSPEGIKARMENPSGFENLKLHYGLHAAAMAKKAAAAPPQEKPPSESINYKDLPPEGQVQLAAKAGIQLDAAKLVAQDAADQALPAGRQAAAAQKPPVVQ